MTKAVAKAGQNPTKAMCLEVLAICRERGKRTASRPYYCFKSQEDEDASFHKMVQLFRRGVRAERGLTMTPEEQASALLDDLQLDDDQLSLRCLTEEEKKAFFEKLITAGRRMRQQIMQELADEGQRPGAATGPTTPAESSMNWRTLIDGHLQRAEAKAVLHARRSAAGGKAAQE